MAKLDDDVKPEDYLVKHITYLVQSVGGYDRFDKLV
jgi:hypothetical protein